MKKILFTLALLISFGSFGQTADDYFNRAYDKAEKRDYYGAISDYTKVIELEPKYIGAYANRGKAKQYLGDLNGACNDWEKATQFGSRTTAKWIFKYCN